MRKTSNLCNSSTTESEEEEICEVPLSPKIDSSCPVLTEATTLATEWLGVTTNTEDCSYSSELENSDNDNTKWDSNCAPTAILSPCCAPSDKGVKIQIYRTPEQSFKIFLFL